jgi:uncharacterized protein involved in exopolysaccharide biosynthesis
VNKSLTKNGTLAALLGLALGCFAALVWPKRKAKAGEVSVQAPDLKEAA